MMARGGDRETQMFISLQELNAMRAHQSDTRQIHRDDEVVPKKLKKKKGSIDQTETGIVDKPTSVDKSSGNMLQVHQGPPWKQYKMLLTFLDIGEEVFLARRKYLLKYVNIKPFPRDRETERLSQLRELRHANIVTAVEAFAEDAALCVVFEEMRISLDHVVRCPQYPNSKEIGTIMGQVLDGLAYLENNGFAHGSLSCNNVLLNEEGDVKIANPMLLYVNASSETRTKDMVEVGNITMKLMQKYTLDGGKVGVENMERWGDSDILDFLSSITSSTGAVELRQKTLLTGIWNKELRWPKEILCDLVWIAGLTVPRDYCHGRRSTAVAR